MRRLSLALARRACLLSEAWRARAWQAVVDAGGDPDRAPVSLSGLCLALCAVSCILALLLIAGGNLGFVWAFGVAVVSGVGAAVFED